MFLLYIGAFAVLNIIIPDKEISRSERRTLSKFPEFEFSSDWISKLDKYFLDQFILRDNFRSIKAQFNYTVLKKLDNNGIYLQDDYIFKSNYPTNKASINNFKNKVTQLQSLLSEDNTIYMMIIPDKNYYLKSSDFLHIDYDYLYSEVSSLGYTMIDLRTTLNLADYYQTDTHWKQQNLDKVIQKMSAIMQFPYQNIAYTFNTYDNFYGVYYGESTLNREPEQLTYLTSDIFNYVTVSYLENPNLNHIYNKDKLNGLDAYDVYLDGASSFIEITNTQATTDRELIIFRDSFASSITPLLINYYQKITLIDNRYITSNNFQDKIVFTNQDIIFMYSTLLVNDSASLKG